MIIEFMSHVCRTCLVSQEFFVVFMFNVSWVFVVFNVSWVFCGFHVQCLMSFCGFHVQCLISFCSFWPRFDVSQVYVVFGFFKVIFIVSWVLAIIVIVTVSWIVVFVMFSVSCVVLQLLFQDYMADHDQQYLVELDGNLPILSLFSVKSSIFFFFCFYFI